FSQYWNGSAFIASDGVHYAGSDEQVRQAIARMNTALPPPIIQSFVPGSGIGFCVLLNKYGQVSAEFGHERLRDFRPTGSGSVLRKSVPVPAGLRESSLRLLRHIQAYGVTMVEFRIDERSGQFVLMEINGRFWGSLQLAIDAGVNFPLLLVRSLLSETV